ncbi:MAG: right-handed parallel beta-helix repeat-containing protein [Acidimicrobiales bacterium]
MGPGSSSRTYTAGARSVAILVGVALVVSAGLVILGLAPGRGASLSTERGMAGDVLVLAAGNADLDTLARLAASAGHRGALRRGRNSVWLLSQPVRVGPGARLEIRDEELRLVSGASRSVWIQAQGGELALIDSLVSSWDPARGGPDVEVADGRAYLQAVSGGWMGVVGSQVQMLGFGDGPTSGLAWLGAGSSGTVTSSTVTGGRVGALVAGAGLVVRESVFETSAADGLRVAGPCQRLDVRSSTFRSNGGAGISLRGCASAVIEENRAVGNGGDGISAEGGSSEVTLRSNQTWRNARAGLAVRASGSSSLEANRAWANESGIEVAEPVGEVAVTDNLLSANRVHGLSLVATSPASAGIKTRVAGNRLDHNGQAGIKMSGLIATLDANVLAANLIDVDQTAG